MTFVGPPPCAPAPAGRAPSARSRLSPTAHGQRQQPGFPVAMPAQIGGNGLVAEVDGGKMRACCDVGLAQDRGGQQPAERGRMLEHGDSFYALRGDDRL